MAFQSTFTEEKAEKICELLMLGHTLTKICKMEGMPSYVTVVNWMQKHEKFKEDYQFARNVGYDKMADDILDIADNNEGDIKEDGKVDWDNINRARLKVDTRKWLMSHALPKKYGAKITNEVTGPNGTPVAQQKPLTPEETFDLARKVAFELTKATKQNLKVVA
jgi:hypothetical protein